MFNAEVHQKLKDGISELNWSKAKKYFAAHRNADSSIVGTPCTNLCEQAVKLMEELHQKCKTDKYLNLKFIATNIFGQ